MEDVQGQLLLVVGLNPVDEAQHLGVCFSVPTGDQLFDGVVVSIKTFLVAVEEDFLGERPFYSFCATRVHQGALHL